MLKFVCVALVLFVISETLKKCGVELSQTCFGHRHWEAEQVFWTRTGEAVQFVTVSISWPSGESLTENTEL